MNPHKPRRYLVFAHYSPAEYRCVISAVNATTNDILRAEYIFVAHTSLAWIIYTVYLSKHRYIFGGFLRETKK